MAKDIKKICYELYRYRWIMERMLMSDDGLQAYSLPGIFKNIVDWLDETRQYQDDGEEITFEDWEDDPFGGSCYVCYREFLGAEYLDKDYIYNLLLPYDHDFKLWNRYINDIWKTRRAAE